MAISKSINTRNIPSTVIRDAGQDKRFGQGRSALHAVKLQGMRPSWPIWSALFESQGLFGVREGVPR